MNKKHNIIKPHIASGFMELLPEDQIVFNNILNIIKNTYEQHGFIPIETPAIEFTEILLTKSGGETEKQIWGIKKSDNKNDLALHFDLTVPLARYVAQRHNNIVFPFRRYQIQKVWRGERPQKGRFRELYQCDIDIVGTTNILSDAEIINVIFNTFNNLMLPDINICINNRKILSGFLQYYNYTDKSQDILHIIDKVKKQSKDKTISDLESINIDKNMITKILEFISIEDDNQIHIISKLRSLNINTELFNIGIQELEQLIELISMFGIPQNNFKIDLSIVRGLDYYTGNVYETFFKKYPEIGSICSGGRFDNLAEYYTDKKFPGVGMSIGLTRLFSQLKDAGLINNKKMHTADILVLNSGKQFLQYNLKILAELRKNGIKTCLYTEDKDIGKQIQYADKLKIPYIIIIKEQEIESQKISIKNLHTKKQDLMTLHEIIDMINKTK